MNFPYKLSIIFSVLLVLSFIPLSRQCCGENEFTCENGNCTRESYKCDRDNDCLDWSDEQCEQCEGKEAYSRGVSCADTGRCIPDTWECDGEQDCPDNSDEEGCQVECPPEEYVCDNGSECVYEEAICNGTPDCADGSDEEYCNCEDYQYECQRESGPKTCIPTDWECDGDKDCPDGDDEEDCGEEGCTRDQFKCPGNPPGPIRCIRKDWVCDGDEDCPGGGDEKNCTLRASVHDNEKDHHEKDYKKKIHLKPSNSSHSKADNGRNIKFKRVRNPEIKHASFHNKKSLTHKPSHHYHQK